MKQIRENTENLRICTISPNAITPNPTKNITVVIRLEESLPIIALTQTGGPDKTDVSDITYDIGINDVLNTPYASTSVYNHLQDISFDDTVEPIVDRFIHICTATSIVRKTTIEVYYDTLFKDMFMIPALVDLGIDDISATHLEGTTIEIEGYSIGVKGNPREYQNGLSYAKTTTVHMPEPLLSNIITKTHLLAYLGNGDKASNNLGINLNDHYLESIGGVPTEFISLGGSETLFGKPVTAHRAFRQNIGAHALIPIGNKVLSDILIPLP